MPKCSAVKTHCRVLSKGKAKSGRSCTKVVRGNSRSGTRVHAHLSPKRACGSKTMSSILRLQALARGKAARRKSPKKASPKKASPKKASPKKSGRKTSANKRLSGYLLY